MKKLNKPRLALRTETLKTLAGADLRDAAGGIPVSHFGLCSIIDACPSMMDPCPPPTTSKTTTTIPTFLC